MTLYFEERTLDISKGDKSELDGIVDPITLRRQEGGSDSIGIIGVIYDGDKIFDARGSSVTFKMLNPHGQYVDVPGTVENGTSGIVSVVVNSEMTAVAGPVQIAYFQLNKNGNIVTTNNIPLVVLADNDLTTERADGYRTEVEKLVEYLVQLKANFKDVASISVAYQAGESPTAVPTGSWSTSMVTVGQGWYLWTRIIVNYSNGTSQTFYMKSYQGKDNANYGAATESKDGLMSASDKARLDGINDYTTGINLLRGTKDLVIGVEKWKNTNYYTDGLYENGPFQHSKDKQGFTYTTLVASSNSRAVLVGIISDNYSVGTEYTISLEFMLSEKAPTNPNLFEIRIINETGSQVASRSYQYKDFGYDVSSLKTGVWYNAVAYYTVSQEIPENQHLQLFMVSPVAGTNISFKKPMVQRGHINNPIWSASPFDIDYINDITTGTNLLRGTGGFVIGSTVSPVNNGNYYTDGFRISGMSRVVGEDGFTYLEKTDASASSNVYIRLSSTHIGRVRSGDVFTIFGEIYLPEAQESSARFAYRGFFDPSNANTQISAGYATMGDLGIDLTKTGEWQKFVYSFSSSNNITNAYLNVEITAVYFTTKARFKLFGAVHDRIEHPEWSASPFDVAQQADLATLEARVKALESKL